MAIGMEGVTVKICGIMEPEHALVAAREGAGMIGLVFAPSRRQISIEAARAIRAALDSEDRRPMLVGVFVNETTERMRQVAEQVGLDVLQLSGDETPEQVAECAHYYPVIKALRFPSHLSLEQVLAVLRPYIALNMGERMRLLLDTYRPGEYGGTGETADWSLASELALRLSVILAGGLTPHNVGEAVVSVTPFGVDVSSGVEIGNVKDSRLIKQFIDAARFAGSQGKDNQMVNITEKTPDTQQAYNMPDAGGHFGQFGGKYAPEVLMPALAELEQEYARYKDDLEFLAELRDFEKHYVGRATPLYFAKSLTGEMGGAHIYLKREDLAHTGAHKINNALGQALLAKRMGKQRIIAETGAGQHGVASATVCAMLGLECIVYMGEVDIQRQALNVFRMKLLGAEVRPVSSGSRTLKDAINEAVRDWVSNVHTTYYLIGSAVGMHPYPTIVRDFQSIIGREARQQSLKQAGQLPDYVVACVGGGSNSIGIFYPFIGDADVRLVGVEAAGEGITSGKHAATLSAGSIGVLHGSRSYMLQDDHGQVVETHSISAGLDYPGVGPEHSHLRDTGRAQYVGVTDAEALDGFKLLCRTEGIIPALESAHAIYYGAKLAASLAVDKMVVINLSGRGDKDMGTVAEELGITLTAPTGEAQAQ